MDEYDDETPTCESNGWDCAASDCPLRRARYSEHAECDRPVADRPAVTIR